MVSICYLDEAGCPGKLPVGGKEIQPVLVLAAIIINKEHIQALTVEFINLKKKFFPRKFKDITHDLDALPIEIKGSDLRSNMRKKSSLRYQTASFLDNVLDLLFKYDAKLLARIHIKKEGGGFDGRSVYTSSTQRISEGFEDYLFNHSKCGLIIADFRSPASNSYISHSVFTQKFRRKKTGDAYPSMLEVPTFGISNNHACLQITDLISSAMLFPMATHTYCKGKITNNHIRGGDFWIRNRFKRKIKMLQHNYFLKGKKHFGIYVHDTYGRRSAQLMIT